MLILGFILKANQRTSSGSRIKIIIKFEQAFVAQWQYKINDIINMVTGSIQSKRLVPNVYYNMCTRSTLK